MAKTATGIDIGLRTAKAVDGGTLTKTALALGTPEYVAPEQLRDAANVDPSADLYSVGVMLYELVTGERPAGRFRLPSELRPELPRELDQLVDWLLQQAKVSNKSMSFKDLMELPAG